MKLLICLLLISLEGLAVPKKNELNFSSKKNLLLLEKKIKKEKIEIEKVNKSLTDLKNNLGKSSEKYGRIYKKRQKLKDALLDLQGNIEQTNLEIRGRLKKKNALIKHFLLNQLNDEGSSPIQMATKEVLLKRVKKEYGELRKFQIKNEEHLSHFNLLKSRFVEYQGLEKELLSYIHSLEQETQSKEAWVVKSRSDFEKHVAFYNKNKKVMLANRLAKKKKKSEKLKADFFLPLNKYKKIKYRKKGIVLTFDKVEKVRSPKAGKVSYSGKLGKFGHVVILKHKSSLNSVIQGDFVSMVKAGDAVKQGSVLGLSLTQPGADGSIAYQIRKNNKVQNTVKLIDSNSLLNKSKIKL